MPAKTPDPDPEVPDDSGAEPVEEAPYEGLVARAARLRRTADLTRLPADVLAADDAERDRDAAAKVPDWQVPAEANAKATLVCSIVGDGMPFDDMADPRWADLVLATGVPISEMGSVSAEPEGVALDHKGTFYAYVGDQYPPDADGKRGVMFWVKPPRYFGPFPSYAFTPTLDEPPTAGPVAASPPRPR